MYMYLQKNFMTPKLKLTTFFNNVKMSQIKEYGKPEISQLLKYFKSQLVYPPFVVKRIKHLMSVDVTSAVTSTDSVIVDNFFTLPL